MALMDHMNSVYLILFKNNKNSFQIGYNIFYCSLRFPDLGRHPYPHVTLSTIFISATLKSVYRDLFLVVICTFLVTNDIRHHCTCLVFICVSFLVCSNCQFLNFFYLLVKFWKFLKYFGFKLFI